MIEGDKPCDYRINRGEYQPQQYHWVPNQRLEDVLNGRFKLYESSLLDIPDGVWISGNVGWAEYCKGGNDEPLKNRTPLKVYIPQDISICEFASFPDFISLCEQLGIDFSPFSGFPLLEDPHIQRGKYGELFDRIQSVYDGIHLSWEGHIDLREVFDWGFDSTVIFDPKQLEFELLTLKELKVLGWDRYEWIITKEKLGEKQVRTAAASS